MIGQMTDPLEIRFVLVRPRNPLNIGAAARAMANFGFKQLIVVKPFQPIWKETKSAVGAVDVVNQAKKVSRFIDAIQGCHWVIGTSAGQRRIMDPRWIGIERFRGLFKSKVKRKIKLAVVFGQEKTGLTNDVLDHCHHILTLPTVKACPSMNLGQAVAVVAYELSQLIPRASPIKKEFRTKESTSNLPAEKLELLVQQGTQAFEEADLFRAWEQKGRANQLRKAVHRWNISKVDLAMFLGLFRWIKRKAKKGGT